MKYNKLDENTHIQSKKPQYFPENISFIMKLIINKNKIKLKLN